MIAPCKDCPDRHIGCHSECEKYLSFKADVANRKEQQDNEQRARLYRYKEMVKIAKAKRR